MMKLNSLSILCLAALCVPALAQNNAGMGSIAGVVLDATGAVVPGAKVIVSNPSKGVVRDLESNGSGIFNAPSLVPASGYEVSVKKSGFNNWEVKGIEIQVGQTVNLRPSLGVASTTTAVDVTGEAPTVESTKTDVSQVVGSRQILDLPINGRRVDSFVLLTPGVTNDGVFGLLSFRGTPGGNTFLTDGNDTTNQYYNENAGRTRTYNISQDAVQEFQVVTSNFLAEYGRASGGIVNTVTRSGSNDLHGTAYWFFRNRTLSATDVTAKGINPPEWRHQAGASIGGPVKANKLFYFFNGELQRRNAPIVSRNTSNLSVFDNNGAYVPGNCVAPATQAQCDAAVSYLGPRVAPQLIPRTVDVNLMFAKIDYHINERNSLTFSLNYLDFRSPNGIQTQLVLTNGNAIGNNADTNVFDRTFKAGWTSIISNSIVNEFRYGLFKDRQFDPASPSLLPSIGPIGLSIGALNNVGYATSYPRYNPSELRHSVADSLSWTVGRHSLKFGAEYANVEDYVNQLSNRYGSYTYPNLTAFAQDYSGNTVGDKHWTGYSQKFGNPIVDITLKETSFYLQDQIKVTPRLTITPGIRFEYTSIPQPTQVNPAWPQTGIIPNNSASWGPRIGIAYSLNDKTVLRGGYGMFYGRVPSSTIANLYLSNGLYQPQYSLSSSGSTGAAQVAAGPVFPFSLPTAPNVNGSASIAIAEPDFRNTYSQQASIAIERELAKNTTLTVSGVWSRGLHIISGRDTNVADPTSSYTYTILDTAGNQTGSWTTPIYTKRINSAFGTVMLIDSANNSYYSGLITQLNRRFTKWFQASAGYTWSHAIDYNIGGGGNSIYTASGPTSVYNGNYSGEKGSSSIDQRHRVTLNGVFAPKFTTSNSAVSRYLVNGWQLSAIAVLASAQPMYPSINATTAPTGVLTTSRLTGLPSSPSRVPFESISALEIGNIYRADARISRDIPLWKERVKAQLSFEAFNVFNHVIPSMRNGTEYSTVKQTSGQIALAPFLGYGTLTATQVGPDGTTARRAQAAIRITF